MNYLKICNIEPTNKCQLTGKCHFCTDDGTREVGFIKEDLFKDIVEQYTKFHEHSKEIRLFVSGEGTLHPAISDLILICKRYGINNIVLHTNGVYLINNRKLIDEMVKCGLTLISFSVDAQTASEYKKYRGLDEDKFNLLLNTIKYTASKGIKTVTQVIKPYPSELIVSEEFKSKVGKSAVFIRYPHSWAEKGLIKNAVKLEDRKDGIPCWFLTQTMSIYWDGRIPTCCAMLNEEHILGTFQDLGIEGGWKEIQRIRKIQENFGAISGCDECERYGGLMEQWRTKHGNVQV